MLEERTCGPHEADPCLAAVKGNPEIAEYRSKKRTAINAGFVTPDGKRRPSSSPAKSRPWSLADTLSKEGDQGSRLRLFGAPLYSEEPIQASTQATATSVGERPKQSAYPSNESGDTAPISDPKASAKNDRTSMKGNRLTAEQRQGILHFFVNNPAQENKDIAKKFSVGEKTILKLRKQFIETERIGPGSTRNHLTAEQRQDISRIFVNDPTRKNIDIAEEFGVTDGRIWALRKQFVETGNIAPGNTRNRLTTEQRQDILRSFVNDPTRKNKDIAKKFGVTEAAIRLLRKQPIEIRNPVQGNTKNHLAAEQRQGILHIFVNDQSRTNRDIAKEFGVTERTIQVLRKQFIETGNIDQGSNKNRLTAEQRQGILHIFVNDPTKRGTDIAKEFGVSGVTISSLRQQFIETGNIAPRSSRNHLTSEQRQDILHIFVNDPTRKNADIAKEFRVSGVTIWNLRQQFFRTENADREKTENHLTAEQPREISDILSDPTNTRSDRSIAQQFSVNSRHTARLRQLDTLYKEGDQGSGPRLFGAPGYFEEPIQVSTQATATSVDERPRQSAYSSNESRDTAPISDPTVSDNNASASSSRKRSAATAPKEPGPKRLECKAAKQEPAVLASAFPAPTAGVERARLNTSQLSYVPTTSYAMIDLTAGAGSTMTVFTVRHTDEAIVSTGKQTYDSAMDKVFPIRAPAHPEQVHPDYADPDDPSRCSPHVALEGIRFYIGGACSNEQNLWRRARDNFEGDLPYKSKELFIEALKRSCEEELRATLQGRQPPSSQRVRIDVIKEASQCDSPEEFAALRNQYGGFLTDYAPSSQPSLRNARIVCMFAGSRLASAEENQQYLDQLGAEIGWKALHDYGANAKQYGKRDEIAWAPFGGGNMGQYFNSTFKPGTEGKLQVDVDKTNSFLCPVIVDLTDRHGKARRESLLMVIQDRPIAEGKQIKLDYGDSYTLDAKESAPRTAGHPVKQEIPERWADNASSTTAGGQAGLREPLGLWDHGE